ncbi:MAG TPA: RHS repeat-associated core domain-containing protein [Lacunisphaera sp.]|nr:RHS repeat-associated core domain-containing protein [Lacunisphaera sp.]
MTTLSRNRRLFRIVILPLALGALTGHGLRADEAQTDSPEMEFLTPKYIERQQHLLTDYYYGFNEFVRTPDDPPPALPKPPKKYATLTWAGFVQESNTLDWIGSSKTVFDGNATWSGPTYQNTLKKTSYLNASATSAGDGSNGEYTVHGFDGGGCEELHHLQNVTKTETGTPGGIFSSPDAGSPAPTSVVRTYAGAMNWHWNDLHAPCNLMTFDYYSDTFPTRGPVTETLSSEVTAPNPKVETRGGWAIKAPTEIVEASNAWNYEGGEAWTAGSSTALLVQDNRREIRAHFDATDCGMGENPTIILIVTTRTGAESFVKYAVKSTARAEEQPDGTTLVTTEIRALPIKPKAGSMIAGVQEGEFDEQATQPDFGRVVRLETVLLKPGEGGCTKNSCVKPRTYSIDWTMNLGQLPNGDSAGTLNLKTETFAATVFTPTGLGFAPQAYANSDLGTVRRPDGSLRQIRTGTRIYDLITPAEDATLAANSYEVRTYLQAGSTPDSGNPNLLVPAGAAFERTRFSDPDGNGNRLRIERFTAGTTAFSTLEYAYATSTNTWSLTEEGLRRTERMTVDTSATVKTVTTSVWDLSGPAEVLVSKVREKIESRTASGLTIRVVTERTLDPDGAALTSTWQYGTGFDGQLYMTHYQSHTGYYADYGNGQSFYQFAFRRSSSSSMPFGLNLLGGVTEMCIPLPSNTLSFIRIHSPSGLEETTTHVSNGNMTHSKKRGGNDTTQMTETFRRNVTGPFAGRINFHKDFAGVLTVTSYELDSTTQRTTTTVSRGEPNGANDAVVDGTRTVTVTNPDGELVSSETTDIASGLTLDQVTVLDRDSRGRATVISLFDGTLETRAYNACCGLLESVTRHGITTTFGYDALHRRTSETTAGITMVYTYDALNRVTKTKRVGTDASEIVQSTTTYDVAGRVTATTDARGGSTTYAEVYNSDGTTTRTTTRPDLSTIIEVTGRSGDLISRSGTAVAPVSLTYAVEPNFMVDSSHFIPVVVTTTGKAQPGATATEWTKVRTDAFGHDLEVEFADGAKQSLQYNTKDQQVKQVDADGVVTLFAYNARGELQDQAVDINRNGAIDYSGTDRITRTVSDVVTAHGATVQRTTTSVWAADGANTPTTASITETSADGRQVWRTIDGLTTQAVTTYGTGVTRTQITATPDGAVSTQAFLDGRLQSTAISHPTLGALGSVNYQYDEHGRVEIVTDARTGATSYTYFNDDSVHTVTTPDPDATLSGIGYDPQTTTYAYDSMGRSETVTQADGGVLHTTYWPTGAVKRTWGSRTYPKEHAYDEQGRIKTLTTWQDFAGDTGKAVTTWGYNPKRGWLTDKQDATGKGPNYHYTPAGRPSSLQRARNSLLRPILYGYDAAGNLNSVVYPDDTPETVLAYDRLGRLASRTDASGTCAYGYRGITGQLTSETYNAGLLNGFTVSRSFDSLDRLETVAVLNSQSAMLNTATYGYDAASRLDSVTSGTNTATYGYVVNSPLVGSVTYAQGGASRLTTTKSFDKLNRLSSISSQPSASGSQAISAAYTYNSANQRTKVVRENNAYWNYGYDALGQLTSGKKFTSSDVAVPGHDFAWTYDDIGNRKTETRNLQMSTYNANLLNQYTARTVPGIIELLGTADPAASITVNSAAIPRQDSFFYEQLAVDNSSTAQYSSLSVRGVNAGVTVDEVRHVFVAQSPEAFTYDADGNLIEDARWQYTWDANNRLVAMQTTPAAVATGVPKARLAFTYDSFGRRVAKRVMSWDATADAWGIQSSKLFLYDGWNLLVELDGLAGNAVARSYTWGTDVSGLMQGAGGVGGLLFASVQLPASNATYVSAFDGNGNVIGYVDMATGTKSASYDYSAFGETIATDGSAAALIPFRFSTKYADTETDLLYYGFRYYSPVFGRWLSRDPIEERGGVNLYDMVGNALTGWIDPVGLKMQSCCGISYDDATQCCEGDKVVDKVSIFVINRSGGKRTGLKGGHIDMAIPGVGMVGYYGYGNRGSGNRSGMGLTGNLNTTPDDWLNGPTARIPYLVGPGVTLPSGDKIPGVLSTICKVEVCPSQVEKMKAYIPSLKASPGKFNIAGNNCATNACRILGSADILSGRIAGIDNPEHLQDQLTKEYGAKCFTGYTSMDRDGNVEITKEGPAPAGTPAPPLAGP